MITYLGYRFYVRQKCDGWGDIEITPVDPTTPDDVIVALIKTTQQNVLCYLKRFSSAPCSSESTTL